MDPVTTIGLASAIVTLVDIGTKIALRMKELSETGDVPSAFRDIKTRLPLIISIIVRMQDESIHLSAEAKEAFEEVVRQCFEQVRDLDDVLKKVMISKGDSRLKKAVKASVSLVEERRVQRIAASLRENVQLLAFLNVTPVEKERPRPQRWPSEPLPSYASVSGLFLVPFSRDRQFVGREKILLSIDLSFETQSRAAVTGIGGVG